MARISAGQDLTKENQIDEATFNTAIWKSVYDPGAAVASATSDTIVQTFGFQTVAYAGDTDIVGFGDIAGDHAKGGALE